MPLYDFRCRACQDRFEARVPYGQLPACPACGSGETERMPAAFAGPFNVGLRGAAARRSNAVRSAREEQRQERREQRREQRRQDQG